MNYYGKYLKYKTKYLDSRLKRKRKIMKHRKDWRKIGDVKPKPVKKIAVISAAYDNCWDILYFEEKQIRSKFPKVVK